MEYQGGLFLSKKEIITLRIIEDYRAGKLTRKQASLKLGVCEKTIQRKARKIREKGIEGIKHGNTGRIPSNKKSEAIKDKYLRLYKEKYFDFNYLHALEMIQLHQELNIASYSTFRKWCRSVGLGKVKKRRSSKARIARERMASEGLMLQLDGSPHKWNGRDTWSLISLIDDATSDIPYAEFHPGETTWACMEVMRKAIERKGIPEFILTDEAGWSTSPAKKRSHFSQFVRACNELDIKVITTPSPESKGRVERQFRTNQDRIIPELRLYGIKSIADANRYLVQCYLPEWANKRKVEAKSQETRYRPLKAGIDLKEVFCLKYDRIVNKDHTVNFGATRYKIRPGKFLNLSRKGIKVHVYKDRSIKLFYGDTSLEFMKMGVQSKMFKKAI